MSRNPARLQGGLNTYVNSRVWPSAATRATAFVASLPLAPALLSITTGCPVSSAMALPNAWANWSVALPAAKGRTKVIALFGKAWKAWMNW